MSSCLNQTVNPNTLDIESTKNIKVCLLFHGERERERERERANVNKTF